MGRTSVDLADHIIQLALDQYNKLPKNGKPTSEEWTVVAAIVEHCKNKSRVVSLATGSKCVGANSLSPDGVMVHDAHAEVVARRGFLIYLMEEIRTWHEKGSSGIFSGIKDGKLVLCEDVWFSLVTSTVPCGDAAIMPMSSLGKHRKEPNEETSPVKKARLGSDEETPSKRARVDEDDCHRTGAKCLPNSEIQDPKKTGTEFHVTGQVRTKPGRGDPTASVSCSDKLARWNVVGMQGALLSLLIHNPICITQIFVAGGTPFSNSSLERAINSRIGQPSKMKFVQSNLSFPVGKSDVRKRPTPGGISWNLSTNQTQVCVEGRKLGASKLSKKSSLDISKHNLFVRFLGVIKYLRERPRALADVDVSQLSYRAVKNLAKEYQDNWSMVRDCKFKVWTTKPIGLEMFKLL